MKGKIIIPNQSKNYRLVSIFISFIIGIILITNSNSIVTITFQIIGTLITLFGLYRLIQFFNLKKQFKTEDNNALVSGIIAITVGLLIVLLASAIEIGLRYILGIFLILRGINKLNFILTFKNSKHNTFFISGLIESIILIILGIYTILFANAALIIVGILLIISAIMDIISYVAQKK